jgi:hypothetical protein
LTAVPGGAVPNRPNCWSKPSAATGVAARIHSSSAVASSG